MANIPAHVIVLAYTSNQFKHICWQSENSRETISTPVADAPVLTHQQMGKPGDRLNIKHRLSDIGIPIIKIRWSYDSLSFIMWNTNTRKSGLYIETRNAVLVCGCSMCNTKICQLFLTNYVIHVITNLGVNTLDILKSVLRKRTDLFTGYYIWRRSCSCHGCYKSGYIDFIAVSHQFDISTRRKAVTEYIYNNHLDTWNKK